MSQTSSIRRVARDIIDLCELQLQLLSVDSQAAKRKLTKAAVYVGVAITLGGSSLTILLGGLALSLAESTPLSTGISLLIVSLAFIAVVVVLLFAALAAAKSASSLMSQTKSEFAENVRWLKATLLAPDTSARNQFRRESFGGDAAEHSFSVRANEINHRSSAPLPPR